MKLNFSFFPVRIAILLFFGMLPLKSRSAESGCQVLVISSYTPLRENGTQTIASFSEAIVSKVKCRVVVEYMDCEATLQFDQWTEWIDQMARTFVKKPKVVVIIGPEAWSAYSVACPEDWKNIPVVLGDVRRQYIDYKRSGQEIKDVYHVPSISDSFGDFKVTGYYISDYFDRNLQLMRQLQPRAKHAVFLYDDRFSADFIRLYLEDESEKAGFENLVYLSGKKMSTAQVLDTISKMDDTYAILSAGWYTDSMHYQHAYLMLNNELGWDPDKFMYTVMDMGFTNTNELGGYYVSGREIGTDLGNLTARVLTEGIKKVPGFSPSPTSPRYHVNYGTLVAAGLDPSKVPPGTVFYNQGPSLFRDYPRETLLASLLFLSLLSIIFIVFFHRRRQEKIYLKANARMKLLIESMPDMVVIFDQNLYVQEVVNPRPGVDPNTLMGCHVDKLINIPNYQGSGSVIAENVRATARTKEIRDFHYKALMSEETSYLDARCAPYGKEVICFIHDATAHQNAKKEVAKLQTFLRSIVDNLPVGLHVKDVSDQFRYVLCNAEAGMFYHGECDPADRLGKNDFEMGVFLAEKYHEDDMETLRSDVPLTFDRYQYDSSGNVIRSGIATKSKMVDAEGKSYIVTLLIDLTEARRKEKELYNARKRLAMSMDAGSLAAWGYNPVTRMFESLHSKTISGKGLSLEDAARIVHPDDVSKFSEMVRLLEAGEEEKHKELLRFKMEGGYQWYEIFAIAIKGPSGKVEQIVGTEKNVTQSIEAEQKLKEFFFKLEMVTRSGGYVQWDYDVATDSFSSPDKSSAFYPQVSREQFLGLIVPEDAVLIAQGMEKLLDGRENALTLEARFNMPGAGLRWMSMHAVVFARDAQGHATKITGLRKDVTEEKNMTQELIALRDKAEESNRLKSAFLANMSHEIRTPLNAIVGFSGLIMETDDKEQMHEYYDIVRTNNELLLQLINDILDLSKIESGQLEFLYSDVDICVLMQQLEQVYRYKAKPGVEVICELPDESCFIHTEKNRVSQVVSNFLSNAVKYTSQGSIRLGYQHTETGLRFYVSDTGKGIAPENQCQAFVRFMKFDSFVQGTGLGLSICDIIVKHLGGEIGVESEEGKGSTFWFTLPVKSCHSQNNDDQTTNKDNIPAPKIMEESNNPVEKLILVAEDNDSNYLLISSILKKKYRLTRAINGQQAVQLHGEINPDLILMDIKMPLMDGLEATAAIRKTDTSVPIIALTAYAFDSDKENALKAGCNLVMTKPVDIKALKDLLAELLGN